MITDCNCIQSRHHNDGRSPRSFAVVYSGVSTGRSSGNDCQNEQDRAIGHVGCHKGSRYDFGRI